jgi:hypothetical protein
MEMKMIKVRWLRSHTLFAYSPGDIGFVTEEKAEILSKVTEKDDPFIEILPEGWIDTVLEETKPLSLDEMIKGKVLKYIPGYSYSIGDEGYFAPEAAKILLRDRFIETEKKGIFSKMNIFFR